MPSVKKIPSDGAHACATTGPAQWDDYTTLDVEEGHCDWRKYMAFFLMGMWAVHAIYLAVININAFYQMWAHGVEFTAFDLTRLANDFCTTVLNILLLALWSALCFRTTNMLHLWCWKSWLFDGSTMQGLGFVPKPAAVSVGLLLFISSVFVSERVVPGSTLEVGFEEWCRADIKEVSHFEEQWASRLKRRMPIGCFFGPNPTSDGLDFTHQPFGPHMFRLNKSMIPPHNLAHPENQTDGFTITHAVWPFLPRLFRYFILTEVPLNFTGHVDTNYDCMYQCVSWKSWGFQNVVMDLGTVVAGAAVVTKVTESATSFLGLSRVKTESAYSDIKSILERTQPSHVGSWVRTHLYKNPFSCAVILTLIRGLAMFVYLIDDHGLYTVDYYVSMTLIFSVITSVMLRSFNPFTFMLMAYTDEMWKKGSEEFIIFDPSLDTDDQEDTEDEKQTKVKTRENTIHDILNKLNTGDDDVESKKLLEEGENFAKPVAVEINLFQWLHLGHLERNYLLITHARKVSKKAKCGQIVECHVPFESQQVHSAGEGEDCKSVSSRKIKVKYGDKGVIMSVQGSLVNVAWAKDIEGDNNHKETQCDLRYIRDHSRDWTDLKNKYVSNVHGHISARKNIIASIKHCNQHWEQESLLAKSRAVPGKTFQYLAQSLKRQKTDSARELPLLDADGYGPLSAGQ